MPKFSGRTPSRAPSSITDKDRNLEPLHLRAVPHHIRKKYEELETNALRDDYYIFREAGCGLLAMVIIAIIVLWLYGG